MPIIGADSTGAAGKMPRYMRHKRGKSIIFALVLFCPGYTVYHYFLH